MNLGGPFIMNIFLFYEQRTWIKSAAMEGQIRTLQRRQELKKVTNKSSSLVCGP